MERDIPRSAIAETMAKGGRPRFPTHIQLDGKKKSLGTFDTREEAEAAYRNAAREHQSAP